MTRESGELKDVLPLKFELDQFQLSRDTVYFGSIWHEPPSFDSFEYTILTSDGEYCLYGEDHVPSLDHVEKYIKSVNDNKVGRFVKVKHQLKATKDKERGPFMVLSGYYEVYLYKFEEA
jgi:hypothetical protein